MKPTLRAPTPADYEELASWVVDAAACQCWAGPQLIFPFTPASLVQQPNQNNGSSYVLAEEQSPLLGFGQYWINTPGAVHLGRIIVSPQVRGQGLGHILCNQLIEQARAATDARAITLRVYRNNIVAQRLYSALGFQPVADQSDRDLLFMRMNSAAMSHNG